MFNNFNNNNEFQFGRPMTPSERLKQSYIDRGWEKPQQQEEELNLPFPVYESKINQQNNEGIIMNNQLLQPQVFGQPQQAQQNYIGGFGAFGGVPEKTFSPEPTHISNTAPNGVWGIPEDLSADLTPFSGDEREYEKESDESLETLGREKYDVRLTHKTMYFTDLVHDQLKSAVAYNVKNNIYTADAFNEIHNMVSNTSGTFFMGDAVYYGKENLNVETYMKMVYIATLFNEHHDVFPASGIELTQLLKISKLAYDPVNESPASPLLIQVANYIILAMIASDTKVRYLKVQALAYMLALVTLNSAEMLNVIIEHIISRKPTDKVDIKFDDAKPSAENEETGVSMLHAILMVEPDAAVNIVYTRLREVAAYVSGNLEPQKDELIKLFRVFSANLDEITSSGFSVKQRLITDANRNCFIFFTPSDNDIKLMRIAQPDFLKKTMSLSYKEAPLSRDEMERLSEIGGFRIPSPYDDDSVVVEDNLDAEERISLGRKDKIVNKNETPEVDETELEQSSLEIIEPKWVVEMRANARRETLLNKNHTKGGKRDFEASVYFGSPNKGEFPTLDKYDAGVKQEKEELEEKKLQMERLAKVEENRKLANEFKIRMEEEEKARQKRLEEAETSDTEEYCDATGNIVSRKRTIVEPERETSDEYNKELEMAKLLTPEVIASISDPVTKLKLANHLSEEEFKTYKEELDKIEKAKAINNIDDEDDDHGRFENIDENFIDEVVSYAVKKANKENIKIFDDKLDETAKDIRSIVTDSSFNISLDVSSMSKTIVDMQEEIKEQSDTIYQLKDVIKTMSEATLMLSKDVKKLLKASTNTTTVKVTTENTDEVVEEEEAPEIVESIEDVFSTEGYEFKDGVTEETLFNTTQQLIEEITTRKTEEPVVEKMYVNIPAHIEEAMVEDDSDDDIPHNNHTLIVGEDKPLNAHQLRIIEERKAKAKQHEINKRRVMQEVDEVSGLTHEQILRKTKLYEDGLNDLFKEHDSKVKPGDINTTMGPVNGVLNHAKMLTRPKLVKLNAEKISMGLAPKERMRAAYGLSKSSEIINIATDEVITDIDNGMFNK